MGSCSLLHRIFPTQELNPGLLHGRWILYQLSYQWSLRPMDFYKYYILGWEEWEQNEHIYLHRFTNYLHKFVNQENEPIWIMQIWKLTTIKSSSNNRGLGGKKMVAHMVNNSPAMQETRVPSLGREESLEKGMETHCSILAWRIPQTEETGRLQSIGWLTVPQDWVTDTTENKSQPKRQLHLRQKRGIT